MKLKPVGGSRKKKKKRLSTIIGIVDTGLLTSAVIAGGASIPAFATVLAYLLGLP